jgi:sugar phosphate isomerase/epimerase
MNMTEWVISISTLAYKGFEFPTIFKEIADLGIKYVEIAFIRGYTKDLSESVFSSSNARTLRQLLADHDLKTVALAAHMDLGEKDAVSAFKTRMDFARELGVSIVLSNSSTKKNRKNFFDNMEKLSEYGESIEMVISLENPGDGEGNLIGSGKDGAKIIEEINSPYAKLNYDFCNTYSYSKGYTLPEDDLHFAQPHTAHYHLKDMAPDKEGWFFSGIGRGVINYNHILETIRKQPERLPIGLELPLAIRRDKSFNPKEKKPAPGLEEIRTVVTESYEYTRRALAGESAD